MKNSNFIRRLWFAWSGLKASWQSEKSFRVHVAAFTLIVVTLLVINPAPAWWAILLLTSGMVIGTELINTAIEKLIDHLHPNQHLTLKTIKDTLAGAVLVTSLIAVCVFIAFIINLMN